MEEYKDVEDEATLEYLQSRGYKYWQNNDHYLDLLKDS